MSMQDKLFAYIFQANSAATRSDCSIVFWLRMGTSIAQGSILAAHGFRTPTFHFKKLHFLQPQATISYAKYEFAYSPWNFLLFYEIYFYRLSNKCLRFCVIFNHFLELSKDHSPLLVVYIEMLYRISKLFTTLGHCSSILGI